MGFSDAEYDRAASTGATEAQLYKMAGNSIVVPVLVSVFGAVIEGSTDGQTTLDGFRNVFMGGPSGPSSIALQGGTRGGAGPYPI